MSSGYCLRIDLNDDQKGRFRYRKDIFAETYINFSQVDSEMEDLLDTRHWEIQLQGWNANCDTKLASVEHACIEYFEKCTSEGKKISAIARDTFINIISNILWQFRKSHY